jgi:hypothetical protein
MFWLSTSANLIEEFRGFPQALQAVTLTMSEIKLLPFPFPLFPIYYSLTVLLHYDIITVCFNRLQINRLNCQGVMKSKRKYKLNHMRGLSKLPARLETALHKQQSWCLLDTGVHRAGGCIICQGLVSPCVFVCHVPERIRVILCTGSPQC